MGYPLQTDIVNVSCSIPVLALWTLSWLVGGYLSHKLVVLAAVLATSDPLTQFLPPSMSNVPNTLTREDPSLVGVGNEDATAEDRVVFPHALAPESKQDSLRRARRMQSNQPSKVSGLQFV